MPQGRKHRGGPHVLVIHGNATERVALEQACRAVGLAVVAVGSVAEVPHWPVAQIVITDTAHLTPWWRQVGAAEVILLVGEGEDPVINAVECGATRWLQPAPTPDVVAAMAFTLAGRSRSAKRTL